MQGVLSRNASEVRKNWSSTIDSVVHERPIFVSLTHGSITGYLEELGMVEEVCMIMRFKIKYYEKV